MLNLNSGDEPRLSWTHLCERQVQFRRVACACKAGTEGTSRCNYGRQCGFPFVNGTDVGKTSDRRGFSCSVSLWSNQLPFASWKLVSVAQNQVCTRRVRPIAAVDRHTVCSSAAFCLQTFGHDVTIQLFNLCNEEQTHGLLRRLLYHRITGVNLLPTSNKNRLNE